MTPEEAIKILEKKKEYSERIIDNFLSHSRGEIKDANETIEMCDLAISALKEIQQYREIGSVEECREAVERLEAKPVKNRKILRNLHGNPYGIQGDCPNCGCERITSMSTDWCHVCGQHLKYDENLEGMEGGTGQV